MNRNQMLISFLCGMVLPLALLAVTMHRQESAPQELSESTQGTESTRIQPTESVEEKIGVLSEDGTVVQMPLEEYLTGVVLSEMPADFQPEALKAQAVVARTYAMKRLHGTGKHEAAAVCVESACCQGYCSRQDYIANGGSQDAVEKIAQAVADTQGLVLTYDGELIDATYFSCSGGSTEAAVAVWGTDVPYLQAVESPGEEEATHYTDQAVFSAEDFEHLLGSDLTGNPADWFGAVTYTEGGGVASIQIGGKAYSGTELRRLFGLRSTAFAVSVEGDRIIIDTKGFGHRVGMSQYGAQAMAQEGKTFQEILTYYYQGTTLEAVNQ